MHATHDILLVIFRARNQLSFKTTVVETYVTKFSYINSSFCDANFIITKEKTETKTNNIPRAPCLFKCEKYRNMENAVWNFIVFVVLYLWHQEF